VAAAAALCVSGTRDCAKRLPRGRARARVAVQVKGNEMGGTGSGGKEEQRVRKREASSGGPETNGLTTGLAHRRNTSSCWPRGAARRGGAPLGRGLPAREGPGATERA